MRESRRWALEGKVTIGNSLGGFEKFLATPAFPGKANILGLETVGTSTAIEALSAIVLVSAIIRVAIPVGETSSTESISDGVGLSVEEEDRVELSLDGSGITSVSTVVDSSVEGRQLSESDGPNIGHEVPVDRLATRRYCLGSLVIVVRIFIAILDLVEPILKASDANLRRIALSSDDGRIEKAQKLVLIFGALEEEGDDS